MKKKFLILSAMLTVVVGAALLQSCSSESMYEEPAYGYYTEEEINVIEAMAEVYGLSIELNEDYYGPKKTLYEFENEMIGLSALTGEYEMIPQRNRNGELTFTSQRKGEIVSRSVTRFIEGEGSWNGSKSASPMDFTITVTITWKGDGTYAPPTIEKEASITKGKGIYSADESKDHSKSSISTQETATGSISFNGDVTYYAYKGKKDNPNDDEVKEVDYFVAYRINIINGDVNTVTNSGSFEIGSKIKSDVYKED